MRKKKLLRVCDRLIRSFNPVTHTVDSHADTVLGDTSGPEADPNKVFAKQVLYGCLRYKDVLKAFLDRFYADKAAAVARADYTTYMLFTYLAVFRLDELGFDEFTSFVHAEHPTKMCQFLSYLFDPDNLSGPLRDGWMKVLDIGFVEDELIAGLEAFMPQVQALLGDLEQKAFGMAKAMEEKKAQADMGAAKQTTVTRPVSPNITKPRPHKLPEPQRIDQRVEVGPEPTYMHRTSLAAIEQEKAERRERIRQETVAKYDMAAEQPFEMTAVSTNIERLRLEAEAKQTAELKFDMSHSKPVPKFDKVNAPVRLNAAAILREDALYQRQEEAEQAAVREFETGQRDDAEYRSWQQRMQSQDDKLKREQVEKRRVYAKQSAIEAQRAKDQQMLDNQELASLVRQEGQHIEEQRQLELEVEDIEHKHLVNEVRKVRETAPRHAQEEVLAARKAQKEAVAAELERVRLEHEEEMKQEQLAREERIRQLREEFEKPHEYKVEFDPTSVAGHGLLEECSMVEMQERAEILRAEEEQRIHMKRAEIREEQESKVAALQARAHKLQRKRAAQADANRRARQQQKEKEERERAETQRLREAADEELFEHLKESHQAKEARQRALQEEEERVKKRQMYLGAAKEQVEATHFEQLLKGAERRISTRQDRDKVAVALDEQVGVLNRANAQRVHRQDKAARKKRFDAQDRAATEGRRNTVARLKREIMEKKANFAETRRKEAEALKKRDEFNEYAATMRQESIQMGRTHRERTLSASKNSSRRRVRVVDELTG